MDIDMQAAVTDAMATRAPRLELAATRPGHLPSSLSAVAAPPPATLYHMPQQKSVDGNTVEMDIEREKLATTGIMYEFALDRAGSRYKDQLDLLHSMKD